MKKKYVLIASLAAMLAVTATGCYETREFDRPYYRNYHRGYDRDYHHHERDHRDRDNHHWDGDDR